MQIKVYKSKQKHNEILCFLSTALLQYILRMRSKSTEITRGRATAVLAFRDAELCSLRIARIVKGLRCYSQMVVKLRLFQRIFVTLYT